MKEVVNMTRLEQTKVKELDPRFLSVIFDKSFPKDYLETKEKTKVDVFEKGLAKELSTKDTIDLTVEKIVKMALACEFGPSLVTKAPAKKMISTISRGILSDSELRKSVLIIADRFASQTKGKTVTLRGKKKTVING